VPEKPGEYLKTPFRCRRSIYTHFSGAGEVLIISTSPAPEAAYIHLSGAGEAGEAGEVFMNTADVQKING